MLQRRSDVAGFPNVLLGFRSISVDVPTMFLTCLLMFLQCSCDFLNFPTCPAIFPRRSLHSPTTVSLFAGSFIPANVQKILVTMFHKKQGFSTNFQDSQMIFQDLPEFPLIFQQFSCVFIQILRSSSCRWVVGPAW